MSARSETLAGIDPENRAWLASYLDVFARKHAHELAEKIRQETQFLKDAGILEPDKFRPCRDAADQIDPEVTE